jgi:hypothetical protein
MEEQLQALKQENSRASLGEGPLIRPRKPKKCASLLSKYCRKEARATKVVNTKRG